MNEMNAAYDKYYQTQNLFGTPFPELIKFMSDIPEKGKVLDLGCGQGRDAIPLSQLGYSVLGIDSSKVGIDQMNQIGRDKSLNLRGEVADIYKFDKFEEYDIILLDSMLHFAKNDKEKEVGLIQKILTEIKIGSLVIFCIQDTGNKVQVLNQTIDFDGPLSRLTDKRFKYTFEDNESGHVSETKYRMIVIKK